MLIVAAHGGGRADLTAGWLNSLPGFVKGRWMIDLATGVSYGNMGDLRSIDHGADLEKVLESQGIVLNGQSPFTWAIAVHGYRLDYEKYQPYIDSGKISFVSIDTVGANQKVIAWEFYVKTYLSHRLTLESLKGQNEQWIIGENLSNQQKADKLASLMQRHHFGGHTCSLPDTFPCTKLRYVDLFCQGGSVYMCDQLGISVDQSCHRYWDAVMPFTNSPESLTVWDINWQRQDWFPD